MSEVKNGFVIEQIDKTYILLIDKDYALSGEINESSLLKVSVSKSYARISSRALVEYVAKSFNLDVQKEGSIKLKAIYDEKKKAIVILMGGEK